MSAINAFVQKSAVHMMTDGLSYIGGVPFEVDCRKTIAIGDLKAALACTGPSRLGAHFASELSSAFRTFDALVADGAGFIGDLFWRYVAEHRGGDAVATLAIIGWHEAADRPGLYGMDMQTEGEKATRLAANNPHCAGIELFKLTEQPCLSVPVPTLNQLRDAQYDLTADLDHVIPEAELLHLTEIQRRVPFDGRYYVGGEALLTSINRLGLEQRVVHRWSEDRVGKPIVPLSMDWSPWRRAGQCGVKQLAVNERRHAIQT